MNNRGTLIVISGFSGSGKGTVVRKLIEDYEEYAVSVSATTRDPREGEIHGKDYFFLSKEEFEEKIKIDGFLEYALYCDNYYGTPRDYVERHLAQGKNVILEIEIQGAMKVKESFPEAVLLFLMPPSMHELKRRLTGRGTETAEVINARLYRAQEEAKGIEEYDYIVINDDLDICVKQLHDLIGNKNETLRETCHPEQYKELIEKSRAELEALVKGE